MNQGQSESHGSLQAEVEQVVIIVSTETPSLQRDLAEIHKARYSHIQWEMSETQMQGWGSKWVKDHVRKMAQGQELITMS